MAMTKLEISAKNQITNILNKQGYPSYAKLLSFFDINLTDDPTVIAYMLPSKAIIVLNKNIDRNQVSVLVRHEILHEYLNHLRRMEKKFGKDVWDKRTPQMHQRANIAGDYEISNLGYTEEDKKIARRIKLNGEVLKGLVTEDDHPDWVNKSFEEIYDLLENEMENFKQNLKLSPDLQDLLDDLLDEVEQENNNGSNAPGGNPGSESSETNNSGSSGSSNSDEESDEENTDEENGETGKKGTGAKNGKSSPSTAGKLQDIQDKIDDVKQDIANASQQEQSGDQEVFPSPEDVKERERIKDLIREIKKAYQEVGSNLIKEVEVKKQAERDATAAKEAEKYRQNPINRFKISINRFVRNEIEVQRSSTWRRFNKSTAGTTMMKRGKARVIDNKIPLFNVYFDQSASWSEEDIEIGKQAIAGLNKFVQAHQIKIQLYYFSTFVSESAEKARRGGGTAGTPIIEHILKTNPQNVIILTDDDIDDFKTKIILQGGIWFLFRGFKSNNIYDAIEAKKCKEEYMI